MNKNYYVIFEIPQSSSSEEIKAAYRRLALKYHPDRNQDKEFGDSQMKEINFIYSILSNPEKRKWYDSTISFSDEYDYEQENYSFFKSNIYCNEIEVRDSKENKIKVKVGDSIYYLVEIDKTIITWKYKSKEYFDLIIKKIFDPKEKDSFAKAIKFDFNKTPLFLAYWGSSEMIIYKEDFENFWITQKTYSKLDKQKGILTAKIIFIIFCFGVYYFYHKYSISGEKADELKNIQEFNANFLKEERQFYKEKYFASDIEVSYILTEYYYTCSSQKTKTTQETEVYNIPDQMGLSKGTLKEGEEVTLLLYCPKLNKYKIKTLSIMGWVSMSSLKNPICNEDENHENQE